MDPGDLSQILSDGYAPARRIAAALSGSEAVGANVADALVRRGLHRRGRWRDAATATNWFYHHAVLTARAAGAPAPQPDNDPLVVFAPAAGPAYVAFVRALRHLPVQQREAYILSHGERLDARLLGVAMDCSTSAASTHLQAAEAALRAVAGDAVDEHAADVTRAYAGLAAAQPDPAPFVGAYVRRQRQRVWARRIVRGVIVVLLLALVGWLARRYQDPLMDLLQRGTS